MSTAKARLSIYVISSDALAGTDEKIKLAVEKHLGKKTDTVIARTERGKPYFTSPADLFVSVSHSGDYFVCALGSCPLGVDVQTHVARRKESEEEKIVRLKNIAKRFFHPRELPLLEEDTVSRFFALWTAKESYVKFTGQGIDDGFSQICPLPDEAEVFICREEREKWQALGVWFEKMRLTPTDTMCICAEKDFELEIFNIV